MVIFSALALVTSATLAVQDLDQNLVRQLDQLSATTRTEANLPGLAVGIVRDGRLVYSNGFGYANRDTREAVTDRTVFQIGSVSKSFTSTLLAKLVDQGRIDMDAPIASYLPSELNIPGGHTVLVRHLADHTSGFPRQPPTLRRLHGDYPVLAFSHFEMYASINASELESTPGTTFAYSNFGYSVLGHILERVTGLPYETLLEEALTDSLGMEWTTVTIWPRFLPRLARPYYPRSDNTHVDYMPWDPEAMSPAGGVASTVRDLARFAVYHLEATGTQARFKDGSVGLGGSMSYAYGWITEQHDEIGRLVSHGGEVDGYTSYLGLAFDHGVAVIVLTNTGNAPLEPLGEEMLRMVVSGT